MLPSLVKLQKFASQRHRLISLSLMRICFGTIILTYYAQHVAQRTFLWGNNGVVPFRAFYLTMRAQHNFSLFMLSPSPVYQTVLFYLGFLVTIAFTLGYRTRISAILFYVFTWSLYQRNYWLLDGGDNLLYLLSFFLMFTYCGEFFSLDAWAGRTANHAENKFLAMVHNYGVLAIIIQISLLYLTSAFYKIQGKMWQNGTAIYYILNVNEFHLSTFAHHFYNSGTVVTLLTWSTVIFQVAWPFLIWNRRLKVFVFLGAVSLHTMIGYFMGLVWFSAVMLTSEMIIFSDKECGYAFAILRRMFLTITASRERGLPAVDGNA
jgi:hypothetical protein